jgi:hypothetical protein
MDFQSDDVSSADAVWRELAVAAGHQAEALPSAAEVAALVNRRANPALMPSDLFRHLSELITSATSACAGENPARLSELLRLLKPIALAAGIAAGRDDSQTKRILCRALAVASPASLRALARAFGHVYGCSLSPVLEALLTRVAHDVEAIPVEQRASVRRALRDLVQNTIELWSGASTTEQRDEESERERAVCIAPERLIAMSFEVGALGASGWTAIEKLGTTDQGVRQILEMVKHAPGKNKAVEAVARRFATPGRLTKLLREDPIDFDAVDAVVARIPEASAAPLVDALLDAEKSEVRGRLLACMALVGPTDIDPSTLGRLARHADVRLRTEALRFQFKDPNEREHALAAALRDPDAGRLRAALEAARENAPESIIPLIARRVQDPAFPPELRSAALHVLARSSSKVALEQLLRVVAGRSTFLGKSRLAAKSPEMLIALNGLARRWSHERRAAALLKVAQRSQDPEIARILLSSSPMESDREPWLHYFEDFRERARRIPADSFDRGALLYEAAHDAYEQTTNRLTANGLDAERALIIGRLFGTVVKSWVDSGDNDVDRLESALRFHYEEWHNAMMR